ncbi:MAG TPA: AarF/ABC1/UbiB kinase family protein [Chloroflexota bacterium]|nr:AarF/ABC1/UbiB kinase family protein [Chloroflexota bacterium]
MATHRVNRWQQTWRFVRVSRLLLWTLWVIYHERRRVLRAHERGDLAERPNADKLIEVLVAFRKTAVHLGVLMIKLGQFLSSRADLLPEAALAVLASLQDSVPAAPYAHVASVVEAELGQPIAKLFSTFEPTAAAAASLGQVHRAVIAATGETVAVKVQRPNIQQLVDMDLSTIRFVIWIISHLVRVNETLDLWSLYREFRRTTFEEIDYVTEAANAERFREMFAGSSSITIPRVHKELLSQRVLVLEWVDGIKINDYAALEAAGIDRLEVAKRTVEAYFYQLFQVGFFHADPHPGNIFVQPGADGSPPVVAFVDFGMVGSLTPTMKAGLKGLFLAFVTNNAHNMAQALEQLGFIGPGANLAAIERAIAALTSRYHGISLGEARDLDISSVAHEVEELLYQQPFRIPAQFAFGGRAVGTLAGVATGLAPDFNLIEVATPYAQRFLGLDGAGAGETAQQVLRQLADAGRVLLALPATMERVLSRMETGQLEVRLSQPNGGRAGRRGARSGSGQAMSPATRLSWTAMFVAATAAGAILSLGGVTAASWFCFALAAGTGLALIFRG